MPWRPAYEAYAAAGWLSAILLLAVLSFMTKLPAAPFWYMALIASVFLVVNISKAWRIWSLKFALSGIGIEMLSTALLRKRIALDPNKIWLGSGFDWKPEHTQRIYEMKKMDPTNFYPPKIFLRAKEKWTGKKDGSLNRDVPGAPWIHGVEPNEINILMPYDNLIGNTLIVGTTRCGKTRLLDVLIAQFINRPNSAIIVIDPKGDKDMEDNMARAAKAAGRPNDFCRFHLAFPTSSIRIDPMKNYNNVSELASRTSSLIQSDSGSGDAFTAFAWDVTNAICLGLLEVNEKPNLLKLRQYVEGGVEQLLARCLPAFFAKKAKEMPDWEKKANEYISRCIKRGPDGAMPSRQPFPKEIMSGHLMMYEALYRAASRDLRSEAIEALANIFKHDVTHYGKMVANFKPVLAMLTTGELAGMLSPDPSDINDPRLVTDMMSLINSRSIVYIGLNALANKTVAGAVGAMLLSDLAACAAARYNFGLGDKDQRIYLVVDEAAQVVNEPYIQILNMAGGSGFANVAATQTIPDFTARLGNEDKARVMLGNFNNLFALRSKDRTTQDFITETFGESYVYSSQTTQGTNSTTEKNITHFGGGISERMNETLEEKFPTELLGMLPNWQYIASISGGRLVKGRVPIISEQN